jgi:hypothetical protein
VAVGLAYSRFPGDEFFWQWVLMHVPHRIFHELLPENSWRVSPQHRGFACAWLLCPHKWGNDSWVREWLEFQGNKSDWMQTRTLQFRSWRELLGQQIAGTLPRGGVRQYLVTCASGDLSAKQAEFVKSCLFDLAARRTAAEDPTTLDALSRLWQLRVLIGGPGSGKSYCVSALLREVTHLGYSAVVVNPTGRLASNASRPKGVRAMTLARALGQTAVGQFGEPSRDLDVELLIFGEIGMVDVKRFECFMAFWKEKLRLLLLVMAGHQQFDFHIAPTQAPEHIASSANHATKSDNNEANDSIAITNFVKVKRKHYPMNKLKYTSFDIMFPGHARRGCEPVQRD